MIGEIELAYRFCKAPIIAVTGTKGKSTTTALIGHLLRACGLGVRVGGNIGNPLIKEVRGAGPDDWVVAEVSSFQLETIRAFKPRVAVLLNLEPDHLDRYFSMDEYAEAKYRICANQSLTDWFVGNLDDSRIAALHWRNGETRVQARQLWFTLGERERATMYLRDGVLTYAPVTGDPRPIPILPREEIPLPGDHNVRNAMAALLAALAIGCSPVALREAVRTFRPMPHRLEPVAEIDGVLYVDDSKATNPASAIAALHAYEKPVVLIAGGRAKGSAFEEMGAEIRARAKALIAIGETAAEILRASQGVTAVEAASMEEAVQRRRASSRRPATSCCSPRGARRSTCLPQPTTAAIGSRPPFRRCGSRPVHSAAARARRDSEHVPVRSYVAAPLDTVLFTAVAALIGIGLVMVFSASSATAYAQHGDIAYYLKRQLLWLAVGLAGAYALYRLDYHRLKRAAPYLLVVAIGALALVFVPHVGLGVNGGRRWIGTSSFSLEPSEFAKLALVIYLSAVLSARGERITSLARGLFPLCRAGRDHGSARAQRAGYGNGQPLGLHRIHALLCRRRASRPSGRGAHRHGALCGADGVGQPVPSRARLCFRRSVEGSAQHRVPHRSVTARAGQRRHLRRRPGRLARKVLLSARAVHRLHLLSAR